MKSVFPLMMIVAFLLNGCAFMLEQPYDREKRTQAEHPNEQVKPKSSQLLKGESETFTGKVVLDNGAYRFEPLDEPGTLLKLTRARKETEFEGQQILLRKYYEKTITVKGMRQDDWIWHADITGQYVPPGGDSGPNMNAPKQTRP